MSMGNGLFIRAGGEYEFVKNRIRFLGELYSNYKGMDNYLSKSPRWDNWMEEYTGIKVIWTLNLNYGSSILFPATV